MPLRRGSAACVRFRVESAMPKDVRRWLLKGLQALAFEPIDLKGEEDESFGCVTSEVHTSTDFSAGTVFFERYAVFAFRFEKIRIPARVLKKSMVAWRTQFEATEKRRPSRAETADARAVAQKALRSRQEPSVKVFDVSLDFEQQTLTLWTTSRKQIEAMVEALSERLELRLVARVVSAFFDEAVLNALTPTPELFGQEAQS